VRYGSGVVAENNLKPGTDARFVDAARGNYQLQSTSPAINRGAAVAPITNGYVGAAPDMGALEYGRPAFSAGAKAGTATPPAPAPTTLTPARGRIEAESYTASSGTIIRGESNIGSLNGGEWVKYGPVDFGTGGITRFRAHLSVSDSAAGGSIEIRTGGAAGRLLGVLRTTSTGGWSLYNDQSCPVSAVTGVQDVCLVFRGGAVAVIDWFTFTS
jgi:endo-1,4-beta-xylanase